jgi:3-methylcrotonyl-CoA carboxylase alpha subunit
LASALGNTVVAGPKTNVAFLKKLCEAEGFRSGPFDTGFIDRNLAELGAVPRAPSAEAVAAGALYLVQQEAERIARQAALRADDVSGPWAQDDSFQILGSREIGLPLSVEGESVTLRLRWDEGGPSIENSGPAAPDSDFTIVEADTGVIVLDQGRQTRVALHDPFAVDLEHIDEGGSVKAPMHGKLVAVFVRQGDRVEKGQRLAIVEAMKMEHALVAPTDGEVVEIAAEPGAQVSEGARLIVLKADE